MNHKCESRAMNLVQEYLLTPKIGLPTIINIEGSVDVFSSSWYPPHGMIKIDEDVERYRYVIEDTEPEVIVECGTATGASAEWFSNFGPDVITVDVYDSVDSSRRLRCGSKVKWLIGSSIDSNIEKQIRDFAANKKCMVILDSDHHACHVLAEMKLYHDIVTPECYMVVEDGVFRWLPHDPDKQWPGGHGPLEAIETFLPNHKEFMRDENVESLYPITMDPAGWLRKCA